MSPAFFPKPIPQSPKRRGLDSGNHASWEEKVEYRLDYQYEKSLLLRTVDHELYGKIGAAQGRMDRMQTVLTVAERSIKRLRLVIYLLIVMILTVAVVAVVAVIQ